MARSHENTEALMDTTTVQCEIQVLEDKLVEAELGPDPSFFQTYLDDNAIMVNEGNAAMMKDKVVAAHQPGAGPKFTRVEMFDMQIIDHGTAAVVVCNGEYEMPGKTHKLKFTRTWVKKPEGWRIISGTVS